MTTPRSRTLNLGDGRPAIEVLEAGEGAPLLFLHGAGGIVAWEGVLPLLSSKYHVYAPLAPGFGARVKIALRQVLEYRPVRGVGADPFAVIETRVAAQGRYPAACSSNSSA